MSRSIVIKNALTVNEGTIKTLGLRVRGHYSLPGMIDGQAHLKKLVTKSLKPSLERFALVPLIANKQSTCCHGYRQAY